MSDKGLTTFEKRFEDWRVDYPWQWIATTDRAAAAKFISDQTEKVRRTQLEAADRIIVSQERIASGIDEIAVGVDRVADGLEGLASAFERGFSVMVWHLEQQRSALQEILKVLQAPSASKEKWVRGRKVKVGFEPVTEEKEKTKLKTIGQVLAGSLRRLKGGK